MYADYIAEHTNGFVFETDKGFASYVFPDEKTVYIKDIYIVPEARKQNAASDITDHIVMLAKQRGCNKLLGSVVPSASGSTDSLRVLLARNFKLESSAIDFILFSKEI